MKITTIIRPYHRSSDWETGLKACPKIYKGNILNPKYEKSTYYVIIDVRLVMEYKVDCLWVDDKYLDSVHEELIKDEGIGFGVFKGYFVFINDDEYSVDNDYLLMSCIARNDLCSWIKYEEWVIKRLIE